MCTTWPAPATHHLASAGWLARAAHQLACFPALRPWRACTRSARAGCGAAKGVAAGGCLRPCILRAQLPPAGHAHCSTPAAGAQRGAAPAPAGTPHSLAACLPAHLPACLPACMPACMHAAPTSCVRCGVARGCCVLQVRQPSVGWPLTATQLAALGMPAVLARCVGGGGGGQRWNHSGTGTHQLATYRITRATYRITRYISTRTENANS
jgi:hypothetical protein